MKLLERTHGKHAPERAPETTDHEVVERVTVPDDLSGLADLPSIGEGRRGGIEPRRAQKTVRWLRWVPVALLALAGVLVAAMLLNEDGGEGDVATTVEAPWSWETDGPGSHSLTATWLIGTEVPWASEFEGPGGNALNATLRPQFAAVAPVVAPAFDWAVHGPGGYLMGEGLLPQVAAVAPVVAAFDWAVHGPGGYLMGEGPLPQVAAPWSFETGGPGSNSLALVD